MDRPHDLGGRSGFGPVPVEATQPWSAWWQQLAYALAALTARIASVNPDALRDVMENLPAPDYHRLGSAGRWLEVAQRCALEGGLVAEGEVADRAQRRAEGLPARPLEDYPEPGPSRFAGRSGPDHNRREPPPGAVPRFTVGEAVRAQGWPGHGHTRLPGYLLGRTGVVLAQHGSWVFPDTSARAGAETPTWVYAVRFRAEDLWPGAGSHHVCADLFEPYLEVAR